MSATDLALPETQAAPTLEAWSDELVDDMPEPRSWRTTLSATTVMLAAGLGAAMALLALTVHAQDHQHTAVAAPSVTLQQPPGAPFVMPDLPEGRHLDLDARFVAAMKDHGMFGPDLVPGAHWVCTNLGIGKTRSQMADAIVSDGTDMTIDRAVEFVDTAIGTYCPQQ